MNITNCQNGKLSCCPVFNFIPVKPVKLPVFNFIPKSSIFVLALVLRQLQTSSLTLVKSSVLLMESSRSVAQLAAQLTILKQNDSENFDQYLP